MASLTDILRLTSFTLGESNAGGFTNWGEMANSNWAYLEDALGERTTKTLTGSDATLSDEEERSLLIDLSGTLTADVSVETNDRKGFWIVNNQTSGDYDVTFRTASGTGVTIPQGYASLCVSNGTNVSVGLNAVNSIVASMIVNGTITEDKLASALAAKLNGPVNKLDATAAPTADDDASDTSGNGEFGVGSKWVDVTNYEAYVCLDATATAAVWVNTTLDVSELGSAALLDEATTAEILDNTADKLVSTDQYWGALGEATLTDAATIDVDMATFINAQVTLTDDRELGNPTNIKLGQSGQIRVIQDGTGGHSLTYASYWDFGDAGAPILPTGAGDDLILNYRAVSSTKVIAWAPTSNVATEIFVSSELAISAGNTSAAHGFGSVPRIFGGKIVCKTDDGGFSAGDEVALPDGFSAGNLNSVYADSTSIYRRGGSDMALSNTSGNGSAIVEANWKLVLWAIK